MHVIGSDRTDRSDPSFPHPTVPNMYRFGVPILYPFGDWGFAGNFPVGERCENAIKTRSVITPFCAAVLLSAYNLSLHLVER